MKSQTDEGAGNEMFNKIVIMSLVIKSNQMFDFNQNSAPFLLLLILSGLESIQFVKLIETDQN